MPNVTHQLKKSLQLMEIVVQCCHQAAEFCRAVAADTAFDGAGASTGCAFFCSQRQMNVQCSLFPELVLTGLMQPGNFQCGGVYPWVA
jgi:hypothetical protein